MFKDYDIFNPECNPNKEFNIGFFSPIGSGKFKNQLN